MHVETYTTSNDVIDAADRSERKKFINSVISVFNDIDYSRHIQLLKARVKKAQVQKVKGAIVKEFQSELHEKLNKIFESKGWLKEEKISLHSKDRVDLSFKIVLDSIAYKVVIELDTSRGDQIAKKFVSRTSHTINEATIYFAFCYPGTEKMPDGDFKKILMHCQNITSKLHTEDVPRLFIGLIAVY